MAVYGCYIKLSGNTIATNNWTPCFQPNTTNQIAQCCVWGDICYSDGMCGYTHSLTGGSGYYKGGCTDSSYNDAECPKKCNGRVLPDSVYNTTSSLWQCCGGSKDTDTSPLLPHCQTPTNETFNAASPSSLSKLAVAPSPTSSGASISWSSASASATSSASQVSASIVSGTATAAAASGTSNAGGLSTGAQAGIGVGVAIAALALIGALVFFFLRRRKQKRTGGGYQQAPSTHSNGHGGYAMGQVNQTPVEAPNHQMHEAGGMPVYGPGMVGVKEKDKPVGWGQGDERPAELPAR